MRQLRHFAACVCLWLTFNLDASAAGTNSLVWHKTADRVDADIRGEALWPLLEQIARAADWRVFVEPDTDRKVSAKFNDLPSGEALRMLLGDLNFALVPQTNAPAHLYVFRTAMRNATRQVRVARSVRHVANQLLVRVKPGTDMDALAKLFGAKITGRIDKYGVYRLQFADEAALEAALAQLQNNSDVLAADYNYYFDLEPSAQMISSAPVGPLSLQLNPPPDSGKIIVGLPDTAVQPLGDLEKFVLKRVSVADGEASDNGLNHGTGMAQAILQGIAAVEPKGTSAQILSVDIYGGSESTTSWNVALGIQAAVNGGANVLNLSLGGSGDSTILDSVIQAAIGDGILIFAAAGNTPVNTPTFPAAISGVNAVTALQQGQVAPYANFWPGVDMAFPGGTIAYLGAQPWYMQGTSVATAYATGIATGNKAASGMPWPQIQTAMQQKFPMPKK